MSSQPIPPGIPATESQLKRTQKLAEEVAAYDQLLRSMNKVIKHLKAYPKILTQPENKYLHSVFDKALFNALCSVDLIVELKHLTISDAVGNEFERNFFARVTAHTCFEILDNLNHSVGKDIIELVKPRLGPQALSELCTHVKELNRIKKCHFGELRNIRHNLFGHRMKAGREQAEEMLRVNAKSIFEVGKSISLIEAKIICAFVELLKKL